MAQRRARSDGRVRRVSTRASRGSADTQIVEESVEGGLSGHLDVNMLLKLILLTVVLSKAATEPMGKNFEFNLTRNTDFKSFKSGKQVEELKTDEVIKVHLSATGNKAIRPTADAPVLLYVTDRSSRHNWVLPWRPGGGPEQHWFEALLCINKQSVDLMVEKNSTKTMQLRWRVSTENVALSNGGTMKSTPSDISYRRFVWQPDSTAIEVDLEVKTLKGMDVCATLVVATVCHTHPYQLTGDHILQRKRFTDSGKITVSRDDAPGGFWLYLMPEWERALCGETAGKVQELSLPPGKTVRVFKQERAFHAKVAPSRLDPKTIPRGGAVGGDDRDWAAPHDACSELLAQRDRELTECRNG